MIIFFDFVRNLTILVALYNYEVIYMKRLVLTVLVILLVSPMVFSQVLQDEGPVRIQANAESGIVKVLQHTLRIGDAPTNTDFDYVFDGGQEILFPFSRYSLDLELFDRHKLSFLYQPLTLETTTIVGNNETSPQDLVIDGKIFPVGTPVGLKYGFDFWRGSYMYKFVASDVFDWSLGLSLQLRNASIVFENLNASGADPYVVTQNLGPVPIVKTFFEYRPIDRLSLILEADGFYASSAFFNGASFSFEGYIWDASLRTSYQFRNGFNAFLNVRMLGGGAIGADGFDREFWTQSVERSTANFLNTLVISLGASVQ
jgi:hypothetical protein